MKTFRRLYIFLCIGVLLTGCSEDTLLEDETSQISKPSGVFQWARSEDQKTQWRFLMTNGVGYGYDAVNGGYCNFDDIKARVIDRTQFDKDYLTSTVQDMMSTKQTTSFSHRDYVAELRFTTKESINIFGLYGKEKRTNHHILEDGEGNSFYLTLDEYCIKSKQSLKVLDFESNLTRRPELLTQSFRESVQHIKEMNYALATVDSFINVYGTHVITEAFIGGKLSLTLQNNVLHFHDEKLDSELTISQLIAAYNDRTEKRASAYSSYMITEKTAIYLSALGGDQTYLSSFLGEADSVGAREYNLDGIEKWRESIKYDQQDELTSQIFPNSTAQLIEMTVTPIWEFIEYVNDTVAEVVEGAIKQDVSFQLRTIDTSELFCTYFPVSYSSLSYQYQQNGTWKTETVENPDNVLIVCNGRYVAQISRETINGYEMYVAYPIYSGRIKQPCGLGVAVDGSTAWKVSRINGKSKLTPLSDVPQTSMFYINEGGLSLTEYKEAPYEIATPIPYIEVGQGVRPNGSVYAEPLQPYKKEEDMFIEFSEPYSGTIVGYTDLPADSLHVARTLWQRNANYYYIYNPTELRAN